MAIRKNRRMQKGGAMFDWFFNMFGSNKDQGQEQVPTGQEQVPEEPRQVRAGPEQSPEGPVQAPMSQVPPSRTSMGGKFRGGKSNRRNKSKKSRRTRRR